MAEFDHASSSNLTGILPNNRWLQGDDGHLHRVETYRPFIRSFETVEQADPDRYQTLLSILRADSRFQAWDGGMVGTELGLSRFVVEDIIRTCVGSQLDDSGHFLLDVRAAQRAFQKIASWITEDSQDVRILVPLPGLKIDAESESVEVAPGISICRFTNAEFEHLANSGVVATMFADMPLIDGSNAFGCRLTMRISTVRSQAGSQHDNLAMLAAVDTDQFGLRTWRTWATLVQDVLVVLRLVSGQPVAAPGAMLFVEGFQGRSSQILGYNRRPFAGAEFVVDEVLGAKMATLWGQLTPLATQRSHMPDIVLRRFNAAVERADSDDTIVDLMIVAEALFLADQGERTEMGYRLRQRAALLLQTCGHDWRMVQDMLKAAYKIRAR